LCVVAQGNRALALKQRHQAVGSSNVQLQLRPDKDARILGQQSRFDRRHKAEVVGVLRLLVEVAITIAVIAWVLARALAAIGRWLDDREASKAGRK
jgi:hypothetical protein